MAPLLTAALLFATTVFAQTKVLNQTTWAAVTYTYHGEKIPDLHSSPYDLTPLGAVQAQNAGINIRNRYINGTTNSTDNQAPIKGLSVDKIRNSQLTVMGTDDSFVSASALAFMQGLYPPRGNLGAGLELVFDEESRLADGGLVQFPLSGYQYPNINTLSSLDFNYLWIAGHIGCTEYSNSENKALSSAGFVQEIQSTEAYYQSLSNSVMAGFNSDILNYANAMQIYEYALYQYNHNRTLNTSSSFTTDDLGRIQSLASDQQWRYNTPDGTNLVPAIAGRTLASKILQQFSLNIASGGVSDKLSLLFGSHEPILSFFALSSLATGPSASKFNSLPAHGSTLVFELFSYGSAPSDTATPMPYKSDLHVRFLFRNGSDPSSPLIAYPLFGRGPSETDMPFGDFVQGMGSFSMNMAEWCDACNAITLFCEAIEDNSNGSNSGGKPAVVEYGGHGRPGLAPIIGGVIGATVAIAALVILTAGLLLAGFRIQKRDKDERTPGGDISVLKRGGSGSRGFKGGDRLASDTDLRLKSGAGVGATVIRHERVGSWELGENKGREDGLGSLDKQVGRRRSEDLEREDPFGDPVRPVERV